MSPTDHLDLVVSDLVRSLDFYRGLLLPLGYVRVSEIEGERGERVVYLGRIGGMGSVSLREAQSDAHPAPAVFFHDPDGAKLELVQRPSERDLAARIQRLEARLERLEQERG